MERRDVGEVWRLSRRRRQGTHLVLASLLETRNTGNAILITVRKEHCQMINLYNIDCMEFMRGLPDKAYALAIVDPDYGLDEKIVSGGTWAAKYKGVSGKLGGLPPAE